MSRHLVPSRPTARGAGAWRSAAVVVGGLAIVGGIALLDATSGAASIVIGTVVLAPLLVSAVAGPWETAVVAVVALVVAVVSGAWHHNFGTGAYFLRWLVVLVGGVVSVLAAAARERTVRDRARFALLADVAGIADGRLSLEQTALGLGELLVPAFADVAILDVVRAGGLRRLAVKASGPNAAEREARLLARKPTMAGQPGSGSVAASGEPLLLASPSDELLRAAAHTEDDLALLRSLRMTANLTVPLSSRGRTLGVLTLLLVDHSRRRYTVEELRFVGVLAGRVALALDNAGLFTELETMEAQLTTALGSLTEAVTVQNPQGNLIYANQAAAELLGYASPHELLATPTAEIVEQYESFREDGSPLRVEDLPARRLMEGEHPTPLIVRVVDRRTGEQRWRQTKASAVRDGAGEVRMVVNVIADITAVKRAELVQRLLTDVGEALAASQDLDDTLQRVADICVPELADWCAVSMPNEHHQLQAVAVAHSDAEKVALAHRFAERSAVGIEEPGGTAQVYREGTPVLANEITDAMLVAAAQDDEHLEVLRRLEMRAGLAVPMSTPSGTVGVLTLVSAESGRSFAQEDVVLACELARRAATAVENARTYTERSRIASTLQDSLVPEPLPALPGWRTASLYRPAGDENRVGGDFLDGFMLDEHTWMVVMGDVTGRGAPAAALTALMRHTLRAIATDTGSPIHALEKLNRDLLARAKSSLCTAACAVLREVEGEAQAGIICAGHPLPLRVRGGDAEYVGEFGPMLGAFEEETWEPATLPLRPGDILVLYSDGVLDATGPEDRFGPDRLQRALTGAESAHDAVARIRRALGDFEVGMQADDTAVLSVEWLGVPYAAAESDEDQDQDTSSQPIAP